MLGKLYALIIKEFIAIWQDKRGRIMLIAPPVFQFFIFTFAATLDVSNVTIGVLNNDSGLVSNEIIQRLQGTTIVKKIIYLERSEDIKETIDNQKALLVMQFDAQFSRNATAGLPAEVQISLDGRKSNSAQIVQGYISNIIENYNQELAYNLQLPPIKSYLVPRNWFNPNLIYTWFTISGLIATLSMLTSLNLTAMSIAREKELGNFDQLLVSPLTPFEILVGKIIPPFIVGFVSAMLMLTLGILVLSLPINGNIFLIFAGLSVFILAIQGIGIFISSLINNQQQAILGVFVFITPCITLSGFATPIESMPVPVQWFTIINPLKYILIIIRGVCFKDMPADEIWYNIYPMILIAIVTLSVSTLLFRKKII